MYKDRINEASTCPRHLDREGTKATGLDRWELRKEGLSGFEPRQCSYCGSLHPEGFLHLAEQGFIIDPTDKNYKVYVHCGHSQFKFYFWHLNPLQIIKFIRLHKAGRLRLGDPHFFYNRPYIWMREDAPPLSFSAIVKTQDKTKEGTIISLLAPAYARLLKELREDPSIIYQIDPFVWEEIIAGAYEKEGFDEVILTPRSGDLGRDVIAIKKGLGSVKFIEQVKAYKPGHIVTANEVRALLGVLHAEQDVSKGVFTTTSKFAPKVADDCLIKPFLPYRLELVDGDRLIERLFASEFKSN